MLIGRCCCTRQRCALTVSVMSLVFMSTVYLVYFHHGSAAEILAQNSMEDNKLNRVVGRRSLAEDNWILTPHQKFLLAEEEKWDAFITKNKYVTIGKIWDNCDEKDRLNVGRIIMLPDLKKGGVKAKLFMNSTIGEEILEGEGGIQIDIQYNTRDLYRSRWDLCSNIKPDDPMHCPIKKNLQLKMTREFKLHSWLPNCVLFAGPVYYEGVYAGYG